MSRMTKGDRAELKAIVKARMKVLRADVGQRVVELEAEAEQRLLQRNEAHDKAVADLNDVIGNIIDQAEKDIRAKVESFQGIYPDISLTTSRGRIQLDRPVIGYRAGTDKTQLRHAIQTGLRAQAEAALRAIDRQEVDLLQTLALDSLETDTAREFIGRIPTVGQLVPAERLKEIEAQFQARKT